MGKGKDAKMYFRWTQADPDSSPCLNVSEFGHWELRFRKEEQGFSKLQDRQATTSNETPQEHIIIIILVSSCFHPVSSSRSISFLYIFCYSQCQAKSHAFELWGLGGRGGGLCATYESGDHQQGGPGGWLDPSEKVFSFSTEMNRNQRCVS